MRRQRAFQKFVNSMQRADPTMDDAEAERHAHEQFPQYYEASQREVEDNVLEQRRR